MGIEKISEPIGKALDFISEIIKPPIKEVSEILTDQVRYWRFKNQLELIKKAEKHVKAKGFNPRKIPIKTLVPLLENASFEEDKSLKEKWANLLVNAVNPENAFSNHIIFIEILKQLSPTEALVLEYIYKKATVRGTDKSYRYKVVLNMEIVKDLKIETEKNALLILENLTRLQLIEPIQKTSLGNKWVDKFSILSEHNSYRLTNIGFELINQTTL